jgi:hypothetical protein
MKPTCAEPASGDYNGRIMNVRRRAIVLALVVLAPTGVRPRASVASADQGAAGVPTHVTFSKDIAPIFQRACQNCHRPGAIAPMSLLTYDEARPWARGIKLKVTSREMPPWFIDRHVGIRKFKDDPSLTDEEIATIGAWVDGGAVKGSDADMPPPRRFADADEWNIGTPDLIVSLPADHVVPAAGPDWWGVYFADSGLAADRYIQAVETKPGKGARSVVHHAITYLLEADANGVERSVMLNEYALGKNGDFFPENAGRLMKAGTKIRFQMHYSPNGKETRDRTVVGIKFHPEGRVPKHLQISSTIGDSPEDLDIPAGEANARHDGYYRLEKPTLLVSFQPHMHLRGKSMCVEAILPTMRVQPISCAKWNFGWSLVYTYADDVAPLLPAGTILHVIGWHDNSPANRANPDPRNWAGYGGRTLDEMSFAWMNYYYLSDEDYQQELERRAKPTN